MSFIKIFVFEFHQNFSFWVSAQFRILSFIKILVFRFHNNLSFWVLSQFELLSFIKLWAFDFFSGKKFLGDFFWCKKVIIVIKKKIGHYCHYCHYYDYYTQVRRKVGFGIIWCPKGHFFTKVTDWRTTRPRRTWVHNNSS